jgi:prepilin-type N-terminal cleavage/methylation domain-containing protein
MNRTIGNARGFTLIEIMIAVLITAVITTIALPTFQRLTLRSKASERHEIVLRIQKAVSDYYLQHGNADFPGTSNRLEGDFQPPLDPGVTRRMANFKDPSDGWIEIFRTGQEIEGALYHSYRFSCADVAGPALTVTVVGDLDGDGNPHTMTTVFTRVDGAYIVLDPDNDITEDPDSVF